MNWEKKTYLAGLFKRLQLR